MTKKYSYKKLEELLPGYVFNELDEVEKTAFEASIIDYPDLEKEVAEGKQLFEKINQMDFDKILNEHTEYLPEKVVARLKDRNVPVYTINKKRQTLLLPIGIAAAILILFFFSNKFEYKKNNDIPNIGGNNAINSSIFSELERTILSEEFDEYNFFENENLNSISKDAIINNVSENDVNDLYYLITGANLPHYYEQSASVAGCSDLNQRILIDNFAYLSESNFQTILENLQNEKN